MYDCQRRFLYLIIIIYFIIYISTRVTYIGSHWGAGTCTDATMRARDARAAGRPAAARTRRAEGQSGANTAKNKEAVWVFQILCLPLPDAEVLRLLPTSSPRAWRYRRRRSDNSAGGRDYAPGSLGLCTMAAGTTHQVTGTMRQVAGTMRQVAGTMRQVAGSKNKGQKIYII